MDPCNGGQPVMPSGHAALFSVALMLEVKA